MKRWLVLLTAVILPVVATCAWAQSPAPGPNVNMVSGTDWTTGDPFLQRQNEPSVAISTRNTSHLLAGANDYRSVDFEELFGEQISGEPTPDAWLGVFKSLDGGATWASTLLPGFPADSTKGAAPGQSFPSPLFGLQAAADPIVRAGTNGMFYYAGIAFNRNSNVGKVFVTRFIDNNNKENGDPTNLQTPGLFTAVSPTDPIRYLGTTVVQNGTATQFLDKPWLAVDVPRGSATCKISYTNPDGTTGTQTIPASNIYMTFSDFVNNDTQSAILFTRSTNCGATWSTPIALSSIAVNQGSVIVVAPPIPGTESLLPPLVYVAWRQFGSGKTPSAIMMAESLNGGASFTPAFAAHTFPVSCNTAPTGAGCPFDQGITSTSFRTNAYPTMAADTTGRMYLAWSQRQANGDARIMMQVGLVGIPLPPPALVDNGPVLDDFGHPFTNLSGRGHQIMPSLTFNAGKLMMIYYDLRQDHTIGQFTPQANLTSYSETRFFEGELSSGDNAAPSVFNFWIQDAAPPLTVRRHTIDLQGAQATPLAPLNFGVPAFSDFRISHYAFGINPYDNPTIAEQFEVSPPNLPMFQTGTVPFMGDYIDVAGAPTFVLKSGKWHFNTDSSSGLPVFHAVWTDNRNVRPPLNGDWTQYTPPYSASNPSGGTTSKFDPTKTTIACNSEFVASRNQDVYTSRIAPGLVVLVPGNQKTLGNAPNTSMLLQRSFSVVVQNTTTLLQSFRLTIANQPLLANGSADPLGQATFQQLPPTPTVTTLDVQVNPLSSISRAVFVKSQNPTASVTVNVQEITAPGGTVVSGGLTGTTVINPDPTTPPIINPDNPSVGNPSIGNSEVYNPSVGNPSIGNPSVGNTELVNPSIGNPSVGNPSIGNPSVGNQAVSAALNPSIGNPSIGNPSIGNPSIGNPSIGNQSVTDASYNLTNTGNTTATYSVKLFGPTLPTSLLYQLILNKVYYLNQVGPDGCTLQVQPTNVILSNIPNPPIVTDPSTLGNPSVGNPSVGNATVAVPPGETVQVTLRISPGMGQNGQPLPPLMPDDVQNLVLNNVTPVAVAHATNTQSLGSPNPQPPLSLTITTKTLPNANANATYSQQLAAIGGVINPPTTNYSWTLFSGSLPNGLMLDATGLIHGTPSTGPNSTTYSFVVQVADAATPTPHTAQQALSILVIAPLVISTTSLPTAEQGISYATTITATGGTGTLSFTPQSIDGLNLASTGAFSGIPSAAGNFTLNATVTDSRNVSVSQLLPLTVNSPLALNAASLAAGTQFMTYPQQQLVASNGVPPYSNWTWTPAAPSVSLPPGLSLDPSSGIISGTPTTPGTFTFSAGVSDSLGATASQTYSITVISASPAIGTTTLPNGQYNSPYAPLVLSANSGTPPYTWSLGPGGVLPAGMTLDENSGAISGTPGQAGMWSVPITVTDANSLTGSANLPLTIGLATAYDGGTGACYMPYPTTPMHVTGDTAPSPGWSVIAPGSLNSQMTFLSGSNVLTGCLSDSGGTISSGVYQLQFTYTPTTGSPINFNMPLTVVGQDTQDNGAFNVYSGGTGFGHLPPSFYQQGVVTPGQSFQYAPNYAADDPNFNGNFLFGFNGSGPQVCGTSAGLGDGFQLTAPSQPGRYDILFDGTTQACPPTFPTTPAPITIGSVDTVGSNVSWGGAVITNVQLSLPSNPNAVAAASNVLEIVSAGTSPNPVTVAFNYTAASQDSCPGCIDQIQVGLNTDAGPQTCAYNGIPGISPGVSGTANITINVPNTPGRYYIGIDFSEQYSCVNFWSSGAPSAPRYIGVVDVLPLTVTKLAVTPGNNSLTLGQTQQFKATATYPNGTTADVTNTVTWTSSDPIRLPINSTGLASAYNEDDPAGPGTPVTITASANGVSGSSLWHVTLLPSVGGFLQPYSCSLEGHLQSLSGQPSTVTSINFNNNNPTATRQIFWLNYSGTRVLYDGTLAAGTSYVQGTYLTHPWVVADTSGNCLEIYVNPDITGAGTPNTANTN